MGIRLLFGRKTDCHVGPMALLAMTDHGAADVECDEPVGRGIPDAPPGVICPASLSYRRGGACPSRRVCAAPFDLGVFRHLGGEPLLERSKRGEKIAGVCSDGQATSILIWMWPVHSRYTPDPRYEGSLIRGLGGNVPARGGL